MGNGSGFNITTFKYSYLLTQGIVSSMVTRSAVVNAALVARMVLTTEIKVVHKPRRPTAQDGHGDHHHHH